MHGATATSLGALASGAELGLHSFGQSMMFAKPVAATRVFNQRVPSDQNATDSVVSLELSQVNGTAPGTWQYYMSTALSGGSPGAVYAPLRAAHSRGVAPISQTHSRRQMFEVPKLTADWR